MIMPACYTITAVGLARGAISPVEPLGGPITVMLPRGARTLACLRTIMTPILDNKDPAAPSVFRPAALLREARRTFSHVNQPSPQQRSTASVSRLRPTASSTRAGSGHSVSHHPVVGISVPSKKAGWRLVMKTSGLTEE